MAVIIVSDTSPLSGLAIVGYLSLLQQLYTEVLIPPAVAAELIRGSQGDPRIISVLSQDWIKICQPTNNLQIETLQTDYNLDRGESEAIALALEIGADELLIDERLGRREAKRLGLFITGLLGVLLVAKKQGLISEIRPIVDNLIDQALFRVSPQLYREVLIAAGENYQ
jgi:predicted nucleic acid-binding protein